MLYAPLRIREVYMHVGNSYMIECGSAAKVFEVASTTLILLFIESEVL